MLPSTSSPKRAGNVRRWCPGPSAPKKLEAWNEARNEACHDGSIRMAGAWRRLPLAAAVHAIRALPASGFERMRRRNRTPGGNQWPHPAELQGLDGFTVIVAQA